MRLPVLLCAAWLAVAIAAPAQAQWKWKDGKGQVHVSDIPPPRDVQDKDILQRPAPAARKPGATPVAASAAQAASASAVSAAAKSGIDPELAARKAKADAEQKAKTKADEDKLAQQRAENCQRARGHLAALQTGQRAARANAQGEREVLDDKGRADEMALARRVIESDCR